MNQPLNKPYHQPLPWRLFQFAALLATALVYLPALIVVLPFSRVEKKQWPLPDGSSFNRSFLNSDRPMLHRFLSSGVLRNLPGFVHVFNGQMQLVGEFAPESDPTSARLLTPAGLLSLHWLKRRTNIDFESFDLTNAAYRERKRARRDFGIMLRCLLASVYGEPTDFTTEGELVVDTLVVHNHTLQSALHLMQQRLSFEDPMPLTRVSFVNPACVNIARRNAAYRKVVNTSGLALPDGIGMRIAGKILGSPILQNVNGTDLYPRLCEMLQDSGQSIYFLGGQPGVTDDVVAKAKREYPNLNIAGHHHGYFTPEETASLIQQINESGADLLLVAMGVPMQENWIAKHADQLTVKLAMGVGGLFDFEAGRIPRAPQWLRELGLEWAYRLMQEPGRMWKRYLVGNFTFLLHIFVQRYCGWVRPEAFNTPADLTAKPAHTDLAVLLTSHRHVIADVNHSFALNSLPLADITVLQYQLESLIQGGCKTIHLLGQRDDESSLKALIESRDWGCQINLQLHVSLYNAEQIAMRLVSQSEKPVWLMDGRHIVPHTAMSRMKPSSVLWVENDTDSGFAGLALLTPTDAAKIGSLNELLRPELAMVNWHGSYFNLSNPLEAVQANEQYRQLGIKPGANYVQIRPSVWAHTSAKVASSAEITGPAFFGQDCQIKSGSRIGPGTNLQAGIVVQGGAELTHSLILRAVSVGSAVRLSHTIVDDIQIYKIDKQASIPLETMAGHLYLLDSNGKQAQEEATAARMSNIEQYWTANPQ